MKLLAPLLVCAAVLAQTPGNAPDPLLSPQEMGNLAARCSQLMESTAVAVPGLTAASEGLRKEVSQTIAALRTAPRDAILNYRFLSQLRAWLSLSDAFPRPAAFPGIAADQMSELRESTSRLQRSFEALLEFNARTTLARDADPNNLKRYAEADSKLPPAGRPPRVVFLGDSITDLWRLNEYFPGRDFINRGISGQTTTQMLGRFLQDVVHLHPKAVVILAGTNDIARGIPANGIEDNLAMIGDLAKAHGIQPLFASILPVSDYHKDADPRYEMTRIRPPYSIQQVNAWLKEYCRRESFAYVDYYAAMADTKGQLPADAADDGLHPNAKGYRIMSPVALQAIDRVLANQPAEPAPQKRRFGILGGSTKTPDAPK